MSGFRLEVETHIITGEVMAIQNLIKSVQKTGVEIDDLVLQPLAAGEAVLSADDKRPGRGAGGHRRGHNRYRRFCTGGHLAYQRHSPLAATISLTIS